MQFEALWFWPCRTFRFRVSHGPNPFAKGSHTVRITAGQFDSCEGRPGSYKRCCQPSQKEEDEEVVQAPMGNSDLFAAQNDGPCPQNMNYISELDGTMLWKVCLFGNFHFKVAAEVLSNNNPFTTVLLKSWIVCKASLLRSPLCPGLNSPCFQKVFQMLRRCFRCQLQQLVIYIYSPTIRRPLHTTPPNDA